MVDRSDTNKHAGAVCEAKGKALPCKSSRNSAFFWPARGIAAVRSVWRKTDNDHIYIRRAWRYFWWLYEISFVYRRAGFSLVR